MTIRAMLRAPPPYQLSCDVASLLAACPTLRNLILPHNGPSHCDPPDSLCTTPQLVHHVVHPQDPTRTKWSQPLPKPQVTPPTCLSAPAGACAVRRGLSFMHEAISQPLSQPLSQ